MAGRGERLHRGRAATMNPANRFHAVHTEAVDVGWSREEDLPPLVTTLAVDRSRSIITSNRSPDVPFDSSINPYRGCEHGCIYCVARPTHAWLDLSPGLDFESRLFYKPDAASADHILMRLPHEVKTLFRDWLQAHYPHKARHVMHAVRETRGGRENDPRFVSRQTGTGVLAGMIASRFRLAVKRLGFPGQEELNCGAFRSPAERLQPDLFAPPPGNRS